ncbi:MAG: head GIN domain-containing protein [Bacteroidota bacterium]|nr:head GIN domain-containing protein [Bacteroidota bacterium]
MKKLSGFLLSVSLLIVTSCSNCSISSSSTDKNLKKEERSLNTFDGIDLGVSADVRLTQGEQKLTLEGAASDLEKIITKLNGSKLIIKTRPGTWHIGKITIYISMEEVKNLEISGSGSINAESSIETSDLKLNIAGSGSIKIAELKASGVKSEIAGSGSIHLSGKESIESLNIEIAGSGDILTENLSTKNAKIEIAGSGSCKVYVTEKLDVQIAGSGDVYYKGRPAINSSTAGSGKLKSL